MLVDRERVAVAAVIATPDALHAEPEYTEEDEIIVSSAPPAPERTAQPMTFAKPINVDEMPAGTTTRMTMSLLGTKAQSVARHADGSVVRDIDVS